MSGQPTICLTFDLEEFDLPLEYKQEISIAKQMDITSEGMNNLMNILSGYGVACTFFTTANYAQHNPELIKRIAAKHEIASHSFFHSLFHPKDLQKSKEVLEDISQTEVTGFRMPRMGEVDHANLKQAGYQYDSSLHPTAIPGRYNNFSKPKKIFAKDGLVIFPATVTPIFRTPLFWLSFKNFSSAHYANLLRKCLAAYGYANIYLHPWEFADISGFSIPKYITKDPVIMKTKLVSLLDNFTKEAKFQSIKTLLAQNIQQ